MVCPMNNIDIGIDNDNDNNKHTCTHVRTSTRIHHLIWADNPTRHTRILAMFVT